MGKNNMEDDLYSKWTRARVRRLDAVRFVRTHTCTHTGIRAIHNGKSAQLAVVRECACEHGVDRASHAASCLSCLASCVHVRVCMRVCAMTQFDFVSLYLKRPFLMHLVVCVVTQLNSTQQLTNYVSMCVVSRLCSCTNSIGLSLFDTCWTGLRACMHARII